MIAAAAVVVMPVLAKAKRRVAAWIGSVAMLSQVNNANSAELFGVRGMLETGSLNDALCFIGLDARRSNEDRQQLGKPMRHHNTLLRISITALVLVAFGSAQTPTVFGKLNWSMTVAQAAETYKGSFDVVPEKYGIEILNVDVKAAVVDVGVEALSGSATITSITLLANSIASYTTEDQLQRYVRTTKREIAYSDFKSLLLGKYGAPANETHTRDGNYQTVKTIWKLPETLVTLTWTEGPRDYGNLQVNYSKVGNNNPM